MRKFSLNAQFPLFFFFFFGKSPKNLRKKFLHWEIKWNPRILSRVSQPRTHLKGGSRGPRPGIPKVGSKTKDPKSRTRDPRPGTHLIDGIQKPRYIISWRFMVCIHFYSKASVKKWQIKTNCTWSILLYL